MDVTREGCYSDRCARMGIEQLYEDVLTTTICLNYIGLLHVLCAAQGRVMGCSVLLKLFLYPYFADKRTSDPDVQLNGNVMRITHRSSDLGVDFGRRGYPSTTV